jgi:hypothetical protein
MPTHPAQTKLLEHNSGIQDYLALTRHMKASHTTFHTKEF